MKSLAKYNIFSFLSYIDTAKIPLAILKKFFPNLINPFRKTSVSPVVLKKKPNFSNFFF